jgi:hypothetical protein
MQFQSENPKQWVNWGNQIIYGKILKLLKQIWREDCIQLAQEMFHRIFDVYELRSSSSCNFLSRPVTSPFRDTLYYHRNFRIKLLEPQHLPSEWVRTTFHSSKEQETHLSFCMAWSLYFRARHGETYMQTEGWRKSTSQIYSIIEEYYLLGHDAL